jgi:hypothetical protein
LKNNHLAAKGHGAGDQSPHQLVFLVLNFLFLFQN